MDQQIPRSRAPRPFEENRRTEPRLALGLRPQLAILEVSSGSWDYHALVLDVSSTGALLQVQSAPDVRISDTCTLHVDGAAIQSTIQRVTRAGQIAVAFDPPLLSPFLQTRFYQWVPASETLRIAGDAPRLTLEEGSSVLHNLSEFIDLVRDIFADAYHQATDRQLHVLPPTLRGLRYGSPLELVIDADIGIIHLAMFFFQCYQARRLERLITEILQRRATSSGNDVLAPSIRHLPVKKKKALLHFPWVADSA